MAVVQKVVTDQTLGEELEVRDGKLHVKVDGVTVKIVGGQLVAQYGIDLRVTALEHDKVSGKLKVTVSDGQGGNVQTVETDLGSLLALSKAEGNLIQNKDDGIHVGVGDVIDAMTADGKTPATKLVKLQSIGNVDLGYIIPA